MRFTYSEVWRGVYVVSESHFHSYECDAYACLGWLGLPLPYLTLPYMSVVWFNFAWGCLWRRSDNCETHQEKK
jgi:hypothetical protein